MSNNKAGKKFQRVLVANRGEIGVRICRAIRDVGLQSVAVYSDADRDSMHRKIADFAVRLPGNTAAETYLNIPALIAAAKASGAEAVHPGYGFLSENADFATAVEKAGLKFIGPPVKALHVMGDKVEAKRLMRQHEIPIVPGSDDPLKSAEELLAVARKIGFPLIVKAAAGGGGRGMRVVRKESEIPDAFAACTREAQSYFGNPAVFCERYIENPRHIEVQIMCDEHGHGAHLFERDCSIQRRHQKLIEEAPSMFLNAEQRAKIGDFAVRAALAAGYAGAGTIEFICESPEKCYFMEMNTRIQVEHTVSELITGIDLVSQQLRVALGEPLPFKQSDIKLKGWGFEVRINAEDPLREFAPTPGRISRVHIPAGPFVRSDTHLYAGYEIPPFYDSMVAKLLVWGNTREEAAERMLRALRELEIGGVPTTARFHEILFTHPDFRAGKFTTSFLEKNMPDLIERMRAIDDTSVDAGALLAAVMLQLEQQSNLQVTQDSSRQAWTTKAKQEATHLMRF